MAFNHKVKFVQLQPYAYDWYNKLLGIKPPKSFLNKINYTHVLKTIQYVHNFTNIKKEICKKIKLENNF